MFLYMLVNDVDRHTSTKIGCSSRLPERVPRYNSPRTVIGSDTRARRATGRWKCLFAAYVPRRLSGRALVSYLELRSRRMHCRFRRAVELARHLRLAYLIDADALAAEHRIVGEERELVAELVSASRERSASTLPPLDDADAPTTFDGVDFAREAQQRRSSSPPSSSSPPLAVPSLRPLAPLAHLLN